MAVGTYFLDTATFANANTVYLDQGLTLLAPDGFYSDDIIAREQISGKLQVAETCNCSGATPTPTPTVTPLVPTPTSPTATPQPLPPTATAVTPEPTVVPATATPTPTPTVTPIAGFYYRLEPCLPCNTTEIRYLFSLTALTDNQRYVEAQTGCFYKYVQSSSYPPLVSVDQSLIVNIPEDPGQTGCPPVPSGPPTTNYILTRCDTNESFIFSTTSTYRGRTRLTDGSIFYTVAGETEDTTQFPSVSGLFCVDNDNRVETDPNFSGCALACPDNQSYFVLYRCEGSPGFGSATEISSDTAQFLQQLGINTGDTIYAPVTQRCYTIGPERTGTAGATAVVLGGAYKVDSCAQCTNSNNDIEQGRETYGESFVNEFYRPY